LKKKILNFIHFVSLKKIIHFDEDIEEKECLAEKGSSRIPLMIELATTLHALIGQSSVV